MIKLETERLIIRDFEIKDFKELAKQGNSKDINFFNWYIPFPFTEEDSKKRISELIKGYKSKSRELYELAIILKQTGKLVGVITYYDYNRKDLKAKLGYWIGKEYRNNGYASEALEKMLYFGMRNLKLNKISASVVSTNKKSLNLLKKFKFRRIGIKKRDKLLDNRFYDIVLFEKLF